MLNQYFENNVVRFFALLVISFIALRIAIWIIQKIVLRLTMKTKTKNDELLIRKTSRVITFLVILIGLKFSIQELILQESLRILFNRIIFSLIFIFSFSTLYRIFTLMIERGVKKYGKERNKALSNLTEGFLKVVLVLVAILTLLSYWGVAIGPLLTGLGIGGLAIAFALQASLANIFAGVSIILDKTVRVGDLIKLGGEVSGEVIKVGLRSTQIKTFDNELIIVPNSKLADSNILNIAQPEPKSRVVLPFGVAYGSDVDKVKKIVLEELKKVKGFVNDPEPTVRLLEMGDSSLNFKAYFFVDSFENRFAAIDDANTRIYKALNKNKIEIPFPQMDVHMKK